MTSWHMRGMHPASTRAYVGGRPGQCRICASLYRAQWRSSLTFRTGENSSKRLAAAAVAVTLTTSFSSSRNSQTSNECASLSTMSVRKTETLLDKARTQWQAAARTPTRGWRNDSRIRGRSCASRTARRCVSEVAQRVAIDNRSPCRARRRANGNQRECLAYVFQIPGRTSRTRPSSSRAAGVGYGFSCLTFSARSARKTLKHCAATARCCMFGSSAT